MSLKRGAFVAALLGTAVLTTPAFAGEFDGDYDLEYQVIGTAGNFCPTIRGHVLPCLFVDADMRLYEGEFTQDSLQGIADEAIGGFEAQTGHELPPEVVKQVEAAVEELFLSLDEELNAALDFLPHKLEMASAWWDEDAVLGTMTNANGESIPVFGSINPDTGDYVLNGLYHGFIDRNQAYRGKGSVEIPVQTAVDHGDVSLAVEGSGFASYDSWLAKDPSPPTGTNPPQMVPMGPAKPTARKALWRD